AGHVFQQNVALAKVRDQGQRDLLALAEDHLLDVRQNLRRRHGDVNGLARLLAGGVRAVGSRHESTCGPLREAMTAASIAAGAGRGNGATNRRGKSAASWVVKFAP